MRDAMAMVYKLNKMTKAGIPERVCKGMYCLKTQPATEMFAQNLI